MMKERDVLSPRLEDYLAVIYSLHLRRGAARSKEIKSTLGISGASVTEACRKLHKKRLIRYAPYKPILMTEKGVNVGREVSRKKETLRAFFTEVLGVDQETASEGACKMEHMVSRDIVDRMIKYIDFLREEKQQSSREIRHFLDTVFLDK